MFGQNKTFGASSFGGGSSFGGFGTGKLKLGCGVQKGP